MSRSTVTPSSGNVFADMRVKNPEAALVKADLARAIYLILEKRKLTQREIAKVLHLSQPDVSHLMRGHVNRFSVEKMFDLLKALNNSVTIMLSDSEKPEMRVVRTERPVLV